jgi:RHS repeat-associated protein
LAFAYDAAGRLQTKTLPNGTVVRYTRDAAGRLTQLQNHRAGSETVLADYAASYDPSGKIASQTGPDGPTSYTYDTVGHLETWTAPGGARTRYYFDLDSNRTQQTVNGSPLHAYTYAPDGTDRLLSVDGAAYTYDPAGTGDTIGRSGQSFGWDATGQLQSTTTSAGSVTYTRDELGRVRERVQKDGSGNVTADVIYRFHGSSDAPAFETDAAGSTITKSYMSGTDGLTVTYGGNRYSSPTFSYADIHGNIVLIADATGTTTGGPYTYDPFGIPTNSPQSSPYGYVGKWQKLTDPLSGLLLMGARPYDPVLGRFLSVDPLPGGSANEYDYAAQDPVNSYDLDGRACSGWQKWACLVGRVASVASIIPGPVGMIAAGISTASYVAGGDYGNAALSALGLFPGGAIVGYMARGTRVMKAIMTIQARAPVVGVRSALFGRGGIINSGRVRLGWSRSKGFYNWSLRVDNDHYDLYRTLRMGVL